MSTILHESSPQGLKENDDGTYTVVLITPGLGSTGEYSESVLRQYGATTWPKGSHSYVDHPSATNPGRSPKNLMGVLTEDAHYEDGVGLVSKIKPMSHWKDFVKEVAPFTGLSIYAEGTGKKEQREGREVVVVETFVPNVQNTVDLVSFAGRGGHFTESAAALYESAVERSTQGEPSAGTEKKDDENMATLEEALAAIVALSEKFDAFVFEQVAIVEAATAKEAEAVESAKAVADAIEATLAVEAAEVPQSVKDALIEGIKAGNYDVDAQLAAAAALREEILAESKDELVGRAVALTEAEKAELSTVKGW